MNALIRFTGFSGKAVVQLPLSKSISNRFQMLEYLSESKISVSDISQADDSILLASHLKNFRHSQHFDCGNAGTVFRFLSALAAITPGTRLITGNSRMLCRPVGELAAVLRQLGAEVSHTEKEGFPPLRIRACENPTCSIVAQATESGQHLSALLLIAPVLPNGLSIKLQGEVVSASYIEMTKKILGQAGITAEYDDQTYIVLPGQKFRTMNVEVPADWSSATYWYEFLSFTGNGSIHFPGLRADGVQGEQRAADIWKEAGVDSLAVDGGITITAKKVNTDRKLVLNAMAHPDLVPALVVSLCGKGIPFRIDGISHLSGKESRRPEVLVEQLSSNGFNISLSPSDSSIHGGTQRPAPGSELRFHSSGDHRMAMAFTMLAAASYSVRLEEADVTDKSYPGFAAALSAMGFEINWD